MTWIERTAYPRLSRTVSARDLDEVFTPTADELLWAQVRTASDQHFLALVVLLKCYQRLGYFPRLEQVPVEVVGHVGRAAELRASVEPRYESDRTLWRHREWIRTRLGVVFDPGRVRGIAEGAMREALLSKDNPADVINVALERLTRQHCELPGYTTLDEMAASIRAEVNGIPGVFGLDTGNQIGLFLNSSFVQEHNLVAALGARYRGYNGKGLGGPSPEAWFTRLHTLRIGDFEVANPVVRLQTQPDGMTSGAGNIGQSILNRFTLIVDCMRGAMYLEKTVDWAKPEVFNRAGLILDPVGGVDTVMTVLAGSPGEASGLKSGDRITGINGHTPSDNPNDPVFNQPVGTILHLTVSRNGAERVYDVMLKDVL